MSTFLSLHYHIVFSTKNRVPYIKDRWIERLHEYIGGTVLGLGGFPQRLTRALASGGIASLNPRLMAGTPVGVRLLPDTLALGD
jgi:hypothetical protein